MGGGMNTGMMKQIQKMQEDMLRTQSELEEREFTSSSGGGAVSATVNGKHQVVALTISPDIVDPEDIDMLSDLLIAAVNEAMRQADEATNKEMSRFTGGLNLPF